jgi:hypothetical protein
MPVAVAMHHDPVRLLMAVENGTLETEAAVRLYEYAEKHKRHLHDLEAKYYPRNNGPVRSKAEVEETIHRLTDVRGRDEAMRKIERDMYAPLPSRGTVKRIPDKVIASHQYYGPLKRMAETRRQLQARSLNAPPPATKPVHTERELQFRNAVKVKHDYDNKCFLVCEAAAPSTTTAATAAKSALPARERHTYFERLSRPRLVTPRHEVEKVDFCLQNKFRAASASGKSRSPSHS